MRERAYTRALFLLVGLLAVTSGACIAAADEKPLLLESLKLHLSVSPDTGAYASKATYGEVARAYRPVAKQKGCLVPWAEKLRGRPRREAPSWSESWLMKDREGKPRTGGRWLGGWAYLTCSPNGFFASAPDFLAFSANADRLESEEERRWLSLS